MIDDDTFLCVSTGINVLLMHYIKWSSTLDMHRIH